MKAVKIYTWTMCPFCVRAKQLLNRKGIVYQEFVIDGDSEALRLLKQKTGSGSVPQIFVDDVFVGGCDDIHALESKGKFDHIFKD